MEEHTFMKYLFTCIVVIILFSVSACIKEKPHSHLQNEGENQKIHQKDSSSNLHKIEKMNIPKNKDAVQTVSQPASTSVLINKKFFLPKNYVPKDLVFPTVSFIFKEKIEKRKMRKEAALALALHKLFTGAKKDKIYLSGVSGYRSYTTQRAVFNRYVVRDDYNNARKYSALPGSSEHQTGLAIDVSSSSGKCAAQSCFANTKEAKWLQSKSTNYGFIIRYPKGKESLTGYKYEPWHIRYVGVSLAKVLKKRNMTLEEYYNVYPVSN